MIGTVLVFGLFFSPEKNQKKQEPSVPRVSTEAVAITLYVIVSVASATSLYLVWTIGERLKKENRTETLVEKLCSADDPEERARAAHRLGKPDADQEVSRKLGESYYNDPNIFVRKEALDALHRIDPNAIDEMFLKKSFEEAHKEKDK